MSEIIKSLRVRDCLLVVVVGYIGFKFAHVIPNKLTLLALFFVITSTMLQNDWRDRIHDLGKGKKFAFEKPKKFLYILVFCWLVTIGLIIKLFLNNELVALLLLGMAIIGALYSETRKIPLLPVILVSITVALPLLLSFTFGGHFSSIKDLFVLTVLIMFGRETLHDIADAPVDNGYKQTAPIFIGDKFARVSASIALIIGFIIAIKISYYTFFGFVFVLWGLTNIFSDSRVINVRKRVDIGLMLLALSLVLI